MTKSSVTKHFLCKLIKKIRKDLLRKIVLTLKIVTITLRFYIQVFEYFCPEPT